MKTVDRSLFYVFLCILELTKGQTSMVCGPDLAHRPPFEKAWSNGTGQKIPLSAIVSGPKDSGYTYTSG